MEDLRKARVGSSHNYRRIASHSSKPHDIPSKPLPQREESSRPKAQLTPVTLDGPGITSKSVAVTLIKAGFAPMLA